PQREHDREAGEAGEDRRPAEQRRRGSDDWAEEGPEDCGAERRPDQLAPAGARRGSEEPRERTGPGEAARRPLQQARRGKRPEPVSEGEAETRQPHQRQADEYRAPSAQSRSGDAAGEAAEARAA